MKKVMMIVRLTKCPRCGKKIKGSCNICPHCGAILPKALRDKREGEENDRKRKERSG